MVSKITLRLLDIFINTEIKGGKYCYGEFLNISETEVHLDKEAEGITHRQNKAKNRSHQP